MRKHSLKAWVCACLGALLLLGTTALFFASQAVAWVGSGDLEVRFVVTDAIANTPLRTARIRIEVGEGGFCDTTPGEFVLKTDDKGEASSLVKRCMTYGTETAFSHRRGMHLPP